MPDVLYLVGWNQLIALLMGVAVWLVCRTRILSRRPAVCHGLWLLVLLKLVTPPIVAVPVLPATAAEEPSGATTRLSAAPSNGSACDCCTPISDGAESIANQAGPTSICCLATAAAADASGLPAIAGPSRDTRRLIWQAWLPLLAVSLLVTCLLWIAAARRLLQVRRLMRDDGVEPGRGSQLLREVSQQFNSPGVKLRMVEAPVTPMLWAEPGNPVIVLPRALVDSLSDDGLRNILAHELGHFIRRDHWANLFALVVTTLFWWNPIVWLARRQLSAAAEACCDAVALERLAGSRKSYAETLLMVVDSLESTPPRGSEFGIAFGESLALRRRFEMIADANVHARITRGGWIFLVLGFALLVLGPTRLPESSAPAANLLEREPVAEEARLPGNDREAELPVLFCCSV